MNILGKSKIFIVVATQSMSDFHIRYIIIRSPRLMSMDDLLYLNIYLFNLEFGL